MVIGGYRLVSVVIGRYRWLGRGVRGAGHLPAITLSPILSLLMPCIIPQNFRSLRPILLEKYCPPLPLGRGGSGGAEPKNLLEGIPPPRTTCC